MGCKWRLAIWDITGNTHALMALMGPVWRQSQRTAGGRDTLVSARANARAGGVLVAGSMSPSYPRNDDLRAGGFIVRREDKDQCLSTRPGHILPEVKRVHICRPMAHRSFGGVGVTPYRVTSH